jgi:DNA-directed RNA polymerase subunit RPC12/RpoP
MDEDPDEVMHDDLIRCPKCGHQDCISDWDCDYSEEKYSEGEHTVACGECEHEYVISTRVSYSYTSPPRDKAEEKEEADGDSPSRS